MSNPISIVDKIDKYDSIRAYMQAIAPIEKVSCDKWADENIVLSTENSSEPGQWRTSRTPYLREILECLSPTNPAQFISFCKGVQIGATTSGIICMLTYVDTDPAPIMYVMPTIQIAEEFSKDKLQPMIENCESLSSKIKPISAQKSGNTIMGKRYPGGYIALAGANSAATLRSKSIRVLILDEVDAYPRNLDNEGSPIALAEKRTLTYTYKKKVFKLSTPTVLGSSVITAELNQTDKRKYFVCCPDCGGEQELTFNRLRWNEGKPEETKYYCEHCNFPIDEHHKDSLLAHGQWKSTVPEKRSDTRVGFHLNSLYSPWYTWVEIAEEYEKAIRSLKEDKDDNLLRVFTNTILGEAYAESGDAPDWEKLYNRRSDYERNRPNNNVLTITAGIDVQRDRVEVEIVGWGLDKRSWSLDYRVFYGEITSDSVKAKISALLDEVFIREDNLQMPIHRICMDSSDSTTDVYAICDALDNDRIHPIKGQDAQTVIFTAPVHVSRTPAGKAFGNLLRYNIGVSILKKELYSLLKKTKLQEDPIGPPGYCHFPQYEPHYFKGITGEQEQTVYVNGYPKKKWHRTYQQNEPLDCRNYARAALAISGYDSYGNDALFMINQSYTPKVDIKEKVKRKSSYWK